MATAATAWPARANLPQQIRLHLFNFCKLNHFFTGCNSNPNFTHPSPSNAPFYASNAWTLDTTKYPPRTGNPKTRQTFSSRQAALEAISKIAFKAGGQSINQ